MGFWDQVKADVAAIASTDGTPFEAVTCTPDDADPFNTSGIFQIGADLAQYDGGGQAILGTVAINTVDANKIARGGTVTQLSTGDIWTVSQIVSSNPAMTVLAIARDIRLGGVK